MAIILLSSVAFAAEPDEVPNGDWPLSRHDLWNSAATTLAVSGAVAPKGWVFEAGKHVWGFEPGMSVWSSAAVGLVEGRAVVAAGSYDHNLYLLDALGGEKLWRFTTGSGVYSAPLIWKDGGQWWAFTASSDRVIYGLDAVDGTRRWSEAVEAYQPTLGGARLSAPALGTVGGRPALFVGHWVFDKSLSNNLQRGGLTALEARTGKRLWQTPFLDNRVSAPIFASIAGRGMVFAASEDGNLRALDADTGAVLWSHRETEPIMGSPALYRTPEGESVILGSHFGKVRSLDARTGAEVWSFKSGYWVTGSPAVFREGDRDLVAVGSYDQRLYALDARTGEKVWSLATAGPVYSSPAIPEGEGTVVFSSFDHRLYGLSSQDGSIRFAVFTGEPIWDAVSLGESNWSSPVVAAINGRTMIYFGSYSGTFYSIPLNQASLGTSSGPWSNLRFWVTMAVALGFTAGLALWLSRRRRRSGATGITRHKPRAA